VRSVQGSSPLARGGRLEVCVLKGRMRFIPARAGRTFDRVLRDDEPRGSSPLARGGLCGLRHPYQRSRFIPARAGRTLSRWAAAGKGPRFIPARAGRTTSFRRTGRG